MAPKKTSLPQNPIGYKADDGLSKQVSPASDQKAPQPLSTGLGQKALPYTLSSLSPFRPDPGLYIVATPIGNLRDISLRALDVLGGADIIACEDTRITKRLLNAYDISTPLVAYHEHNADHAGPELIKHLENGAIVALVSDAGTPLISDPGYRLVEAVRGLGLPLFPIPGASAPMAALSAAGHATDRFIFAGFPPAKGAARSRFLDGVCDLSMTVVLFESPKRLAKCLMELAQRTPEREGVVARELTKLFEEFRSGTVGELASHYKDASTPKGEIVLLLGPLGEDDSLDDDQINQLLQDALTKKSLKDAVKHITTLTGKPRKVIYQMALDMAKL